MTRWIGLLGTHGWPDDPSQEWWHPRSAFAQFLARLDVVHARPEKPFVWSGDVDGIPFLSGKDWEAGAEAFGYYAEDLPFESRNVVAHSHGGQVALLAAADGLRLRSLVMVGTPVRKDIERVIATIAVRNIDRVLHISDARWDWMGLAGAFFDFRVSFRRHFRVPGLETARVRGIGHSGLLRDPRLFPLWLEHGWLRVLTGAAAAAPEERV